MAGAMLEERLQADELMDDPDLPEATYHAVLADLAKVNRVTMAYRPTIAFLERVLRGWDCVISGLVAHHMSREELVLFLRFMEAEARAGWFVNDLHRHGFSYAGYPVLATLARWHPIVRQDGRTSIARSYRPAEWDSLLAEAGVSEAQVQRFFPFRLCVSRIR